MIMQSDGDFLTANAVSQNLSENSSEFSNRYLKNGESSVKHILARTDGEYLTFAH